MILYNVSYFRYILKFRFEQETEGHNQHNVESTETRTEIISLDVVLKNIDVEMPHQYKTIVETILKFNYNKRNCLQSTGTRVRRLTGAIAYPRHLTGKCDSLNMSVLCTLLSCHVIINVCFLSCTCDRKFDMNI